MRLSLRRIFLPSIICSGSVCFFSRHYQKTNDFPITSDDFVKNKFGQDEKRIISNALKIINHEDDSLKIFLPTFFETVSATPILISKPEIFKSQQHNLYHILHTSPLDNEQKLWGEFLIGLNGFQLSIELLHQFTGYLYSQGKIKTRPENNLSQLQHEICSQLETNSNHNFTPALE